jgi:hypothetical protein
LGVGEVNPAAEIIDRRKGDRHGACREIALAVGSVFVGAFFSLLASWIVAERYFKRQRKIDEWKEQLELHLAYERLMHSFFALAGKRPKSSATRIAMSEFKAKLKICNPKYEAEQMYNDASTQAANMLRDNPEDFEDIPK